MMSFKLGKQDRAGNIQLLGDLFPAILRNFGLEREATLEMIRTEWPGIVGDMAALSRPEKLNDGVLFISSEHPIVSNEITMMKNAIMSRFNEKFNAGITDIKFINNGTQQRG